MQGERAAESNEVLEKGEDYEVVEWILDDYDNPVDISGDTFRAQVRAYAGSPEVLADFTFDVFYDSAAGHYKYRRMMAREVIDALNVAAAFWDQFQEQPDGKVAKNLYGTITVIGNITDPTGGA